MADSIADSPERSALTRAEAQEVLRYWLASVQLEEALSSRPRARRTAAASQAIRIDAPSAGQDYFKVALDPAAESLVCQQRGLAKAFDAELGAFFEHWLLSQYRRGEDDRELSHLLAFPVVHLPRGELAGLLRYNVRVRFGAPGAAAFKVPSRSERRRKEFPEPPCEARVSAAERGARQWPFFVDTRLLHQQLGVSRERIDALYAALRACPELDEQKMLALICAALEAELRERTAGEAADGGEPAEASHLARLTRAVAALLARSAGRAKVYPVGIVLDSSRAKTTWHLQRELQLLLEERPEVAWDLDSCLGAYLTGGALASGLCVQRALFSGPALSPSQRSAAERVWGSRLCAVQGPPGTGKTTLILHLAAETLVRQVEALEARGEMGDAVLVVASTNNRAVDNVVDPLASGELPLALRAGSQRVCEHMLAPQLAAARTWLERARRVPASERARTLELALERFKQARERVADVQAARARACDAHTERAQLVFELARLPGVGRAPALQLAPAVAAELDKALGKAHPRLAELCELCDGPASLSQLTAVGRQSRKLRKRTLPALEDACAAAGLPLELGLPPNLPPSTDPEVLMEAWQAAADAALAQIEALQQRLGEATAARRSRELAQRLRRRLAELEAEPRVDTVDAPSDDPAQRELFEAALAAREAWAAERVEDLHPVVSAALEAARGDSSLRSLWSDDRRAFRPLRQLFGVWGCTLLSLGNCFPARREAIGRLVIDEAGQCHPAYAVGGLMRSDSALIIGDVHQLEPVIDLEPADDERVIQATKLTLSAGALAPFRVHAAARSSVQALADRAVDERPRLTDHFRCQPEIISICDALCRYGLQVHTPRQGPLAPLPFLPSPVSFVDVGGEQERLGGSWHNAKELAETLELFHALVRAGIEPSDIAVITPYRGQLEQLRTQFQRAGIAIDRSTELLDLEDAAPGGANHGVALGTVHRFQGGERSVVLFTSVVTRRGSLAFLDERVNLLNVAISRARHRFVALGDRALLSTGRCTSLLTRAAENLRPDDYRSQLSLIS